MLHPREFAPRAHIESSMEFAEWEACHAAGCDMWRWYSSEYPVAFKAKVMAWHELHELVKLHRQDAALGRQGTKGARVRKRRR